MRYLMVLILGIAAGIAAYAFIIHVFIGLARRPRDRTHLIFALLSLSIAAHVPSVIVMQTTTDLSGYMVIHKYFFGPTALVALVCFMWFVACYTGVWPRRFLIAMSLWVTLSIALHVILPFGILYTDVSGLNQITMAWGEQIVSARGTPNPLRVSFDLFNVASFIFCFYALVRQYRSGNRRRALMLGLALAVYLFSRVFDSLIGMGVIHSIRIAEVAFVGIVVTMSLALSYEVTQTEQQLHTYQEHLHELVAARTDELTCANAQLGQEIHERRLLDAVLERRVEQLAALKQIAEIAIRMNDLTAALQAVSEIATTLFAARLTLILLPAESASDLRVMVSYERSGGPIDPLRLQAAFRLPLMEQPPDGGQALVLADLHAQPLPPELQTFISTYQVHSIIQLPLSIRGTLVGVMAVALDQAGRTVTRDEVSLAEMIAADISVAIDNTRLYQRSLAARERLTVLYQAAQAMSRASLDPERLYAEIHDALARLMPAEGLAIAMYDQPNQEIEYVYLADPSGRSPGRRAPLATSFAGDLLRRNASMRINDFKALPHSEPAFERFGNQPESASGVAALLRGSEQMLGMLCVHSYAGGTYSDEDEETLKLLAAHAAIALENARLHAQAHELAASEERTRLARELHDSVSQSLYAASLLTETLPLVWNRNAAEGARNLTKVRQLVRGALAEMRTLLFELRPAALIAAEMGTLLKQLGDVLTGRTRIPVELIVEGQGAVPADVKLAVYRIAQEALNNITKHADATQVALTYRVLPEGLLLAVRDDGRGFDLTRVSGEHMGLRIMAERAAGVGARLSINMASQGGTEVVVRWPGG